MKHWERFLDSIDSPGGHILLLVGLLCGGLAVSNMELTVGATAALFLRLRSGESNHARQNGTKETA